MDLKGSLKRWTPEQRQLVFPMELGRIGRYGAVHELMWRPLLTAAKLSYRKPHSMRHSYATWMLEEGADLRYVKDQMGHSSIHETEGTYGHLERERHEQRVDLDHVLRPTASTGTHSASVASVHQRYHDASDSSQHPPDDDTDYRSLHTNAHHTLGLSRRAQRTRR